MHRLALHGVPTSPALWARVPLALDVPALGGGLRAQVAAVVPRITAESVVIGHDLGGVVAAMAVVAAGERGVRARRVVLCGTALGPYWAMVRVTAWPGLWRYFYARHGGRRFVAGAVHPSRAAEALAAFPGADPAEMREVARGMRPPANLAARLAATAPVSLLWGRDDRWYPPAVAHAVARGTGGALHWTEGGHFAMWEAPARWAEAFRVAGG